METLPVTYRANQNAGMTSVLFEEWITNWDTALRKEGHKILVLFNSCSAHSQKISMLTNKWLEFLYANPISRVHPIYMLYINLYMGIIKNLKSFYRKDLAQMTIDAIEDNLISLSGKTTNVSSKILLFDAMHL